jgi:hypothetical protein
VGKAGTPGLVAQLVRAIHSSKSIKIFVYIIYFSYICVMQEFKKSNRIVKGYLVIYQPNHPTSMKSGNWKGYIYEHIYLMEKELGRSLLPNEEIHHLDLDRLNNSSNNLIVLDKKFHGRLHRWINRGAPMLKDIERIPFNSVKSKLRCEICNTPLKLKQRRYCSFTCMQKDRKSKMQNIGLEEVLSKLSHRSMLSVSKDYNISDNGLKKWLFKKHHFNKTTLSEALNTFRERTETSGEVQPS